MKRLIDFFYPVRRYQDILTSHNIVFDALFTQDGAFKLSIIVPFGVRFATLVAKTHHIAGSITKPGRGCLTYMHVTYTTPTQKTYLLNIAKLLLLSRSKQLLMRWVGFI